MAQSQRHGFTWENDTRKKVFKMDCELNNTDKYDIPRCKNKLNPNENISIKTTGSGNICCGDILRFYDYEFDTIGEIKNTIIVIKYVQQKNKKIIEKIYEINYNKECHKKFFGTIKKKDIQKYVTSVKDIPKNIKGNEAGFKYKDEKNSLQEKMGILQINPKVDSKNQRRVQCSFNIDNLPEEFINYKSNDEMPNLIREVEISLSILSTKRKRSGNNKEYYLDIARKNKKICRGFSKLNKTKLIELLKSKKLIE